MEKLYYVNSKCLEFQARVLICEPENGQYALQLDRSALFPGGGGQLPDSGTLNGIPVTDAEEKGNIIKYYVNQMIPAGTIVTGAVEREPRLRRMQNHSGEHVVSGLVHRLFGYDNVGFHMGSEWMTIDFSGELNPAQLEQVETLANLAVRDNLPIRTWFPESEELSHLEYRSKLELTENVRIVEIPGIDRCACCAPHVERTGEIGLIKILSSDRHRGGMRITLVCGMDALDAIRAMERNNNAVSVQLSARKNETGAAVARLLAERENQRLALDAVSLRCVQLLAERTAPAEGCVCLFENQLDDIARRELVNLLMPKCRMAAVFSGDDANGYQYIIGSSVLNMKKEAAAVNAAIQGRGGGRPEMITGRCSARAEVIRQYFQ